MTEHKSITILKISIAGWCIIRVACLFFIDHINLFEVHNIAVNMVNNGEMSYFYNGQINYNYQFPVYPSLLFMVYKFVGIIPKAGILLNLIFHSLATFFSFYIFQWFTQNSNVDLIKKQSATIAFIASLGILFHPLVNYYTCMIIHPFSLTLLLFILCLYTSIEYVKHQTLKKLIMFGIFYGLAMLDRTTSVVYITPIVLYLLSTQSIRLVLQKTSLMLSIGVLVMIPWLYRNYSIYHTLSINSSFGQNLWLGIQPETGGTTYLPNGRTYYSLIPEHEWKSIFQLNSVEQSAYFQEKYIQSIKLNPELFFNMYVLKLKNFWFFRAHIGTEYNPSIKRYIPLYLVGYSLILLLSTIYIYKDQKIAFFILSIPICLSLFHALFYVETRHRVMIEPMLLFMAICSIFIITPQLNKKRAGEH